MYSYAPTVFRPTIPVPPSTRSSPPPEEGTGWKLPDDYRTAADYKLMTYSGYSRAAVNTQLFKQLEHADYETAFYWAAELMCAGHWEDVWFTVLYYISIHVNVGNILLPGYIWMRRCTAKSIVDRESGAFAYRNNDDLRILMSEVITVAIMAKQTPPITMLKLKPDIELSMNLLSSKLEATASYTDLVMLSDDTEEIKVPLNEFMYHLGYSDDPSQTLPANRMMQACYWMEWLLLFEQSCRSNKCPLELHSRSFYDVHVHLKSDVVFLIWDVLRFSVDREPDTPTRQSKQKTLHYLLQLFCVSYSRTIAKKRKHILYYAIAVVTARAFSETSLMDDPVLWETLKSQIFKTYQLLKDHVHQNKQLPSSYGGSDLDMAFLHL